VPYGGGSVKGNGGICGFGKITDLKIKGTKKF